MRRPRADDGEFAVAGSICIPRPDSSRRSTSWPPRAAPSESSWPWAYLQPAHEPNRTYEREEFPYGPGGLSRL